MTRLQGAYACTNLNPLGACAITGTGFNIDRQLTADLLGLLGANGQHLRQHCDGRLPSRERRRPRWCCSTGLGRFVQDLLLWSTSEFDYIRLGDGFVQGSSIMPQKRNPVALEHARVIGSKARRTGAGGHDRRAQHAVWRHQRHGRRPAAAGVLDVQRRDRAVQHRRRGTTDGHVRCRHGSRRAPAMAGRP